MSEFNFKITEDQRPGGGVYKVGTLGGGALSVTLKQSDFPTVDLSKLTKENFFLRTTCNASARAQVTTNAYQNVVQGYYGGNVSHSYSYNNGSGTVTVSESNRGAWQEKYLGDYAKDTKYGSYNHVVYMTRDAIRY